MNSFTPRPGLWKAPVSGLAWAHLSQTWAVFSCCLRARHLLCPLPEPEAELCQCLRGKGLADPGGPAQIRRAPVAEPGGAAGPRSCSAGSSQKAGATVRKYRNKPKHIQTLVGPWPAALHFSQERRDSGRWWLAVTAQHHLAGETGRTLGRWAQQQQKRINFRKGGFFKNSKGNDII